MDGNTSTAIMHDTRAPADPLNTHLDVDSQGRCIDCGALPAKRPVCLGMIAFLGERKACGADNDVTDYNSLPDVVFGGAR